MKQCKSCPFKKSAKLADIPGYREEKHRKLDNTIVEGAASLCRPQLNVMACHHSTEGDDRICVGWAYNQIGPGNNIALRLRARHDPRLQKLEVDGEQHETFEDTLPENRNRRRRRS